MDVRIRKAEQGDSRFIAEVMHASMLPGAGRGLFDDALSHTGVDPIAFHEALLLTGRNNWGQLDSFLILETEDQPQAAAMGAFLSSMTDLRPLTGEGFQAVSEHFGWTKEVSREFWRAYLMFFGPFGTAPQLFQPGEYVHEYAAVRPELRGKGLHRRLLEAHADRARSMGCKTLGGTAILGNEAVMASYARFGFREHSRFGPEFYKGKFPGIIRYVYDL